MLLRAMQRQSPDLVPPSAIRQWVHDDETVTGKRFFFLKESLGVTVTHHNEVESPARNFYHRILQRPNVARPSHHYRPGSCLDSYDEACIRLS